MLIISNKNKIKKYFSIEIFLFIIFNTLMYINSFLNTGNIIKTLIVINISLLLSIKDRNIALFYLFLMGALFLSDNIALGKLISGIVVFYISYYIAINYASVIRSMLILILLFNAIFMIVEMNAIFPSIIYYKQYHMPLIHPFYQYPFLIENIQISQSQIRPSGIFYNTILYTLEILFITSILFYRIKSILLIFIITFILVFSGSTALLLISFILILLTVNINSKKIILIFLLSTIFWLLVYYFLYPVLFSYNYNFAKFFISFETRFDFNSINSAFTANKIFFSASIFIIYSVYFILNKSGLKFNKYTHLYIGVVILVALIVHNFLFEIKLYVFTGLLIGYISVYNNKLKKNEI